MKDNFELKISSDGTIETIYQEGLEKFAEEMGGDVAQACRVSNVEWEQAGERLCHRGWTVRSVSVPDLALRRVRPDLIAPSKKGPIAYFKTREEALAEEVRFFWELKGNGNG